MNNLDTFLVEIKPTPNDLSNEKYLVIGLKKVSRLLDLIARSEKCFLISVKKIGLISDYNDLVEDLTDEQRPEGLDYGCKFI